MKILLLEDDEILNDIITCNLKEQDNDVYSVFDGIEAQEAIYENSFDLLLLDVNVPNINGFKLLKTLREEGINTPAIFITSLNDTKDLKEGFLSGCDDYIKKPFEFKELELRIKNIKRLYKIDSTHIVNISKEIAYNFNLSTITTENKTYILSKKESRIFEYFLKNRHRTISLEELEVNIWSYDERPSDSTIRTYIKNFRKRVGEQCITTVKGVGYIFN